MAEAIIKLDIVGQLDVDATLFALCLDRAARFPSTNFSEYASRVETLVEIYENISCQRVTEEVE